MKFLSLAFLCCCLLPAFAQKSRDRNVYQMMVYHFNAAQEQGLDSYLEKDLLPAIRRAGVKKVGVFKPVANDTATTKRLFVFVAHKNGTDAVKLKSVLEADKSYQQQAAAFLQAPHDKPSLGRIETVLMQAFQFAPEPTLPSLTGTVNERIYELRSYESASEKLYKSKVHMFNEGGEIELFKRLQFNAVFYGEVIAGSRMPNFFYMTSFNSMADRDAHWKTFVDDAEWKTLSAKPEYQHNVSRIEITLMHATPYSDF
ncbi:NIPSNAP family protein [Flavihumibacter solisilvae]|uniref:NIPSNAP domain-containing protein n=1 Tax=Flavihumibacter solisilvae TaxID=1349421 RepID=A0A0C1LKH3_9BACT|nr:NIPSNAP family protein [Flavihumibacter solisilvae]KIC95863.1 hypothetical protein OI18_04345 [Flavihumibacter solisilvae]